MDLNAWCSGHINGTGNSSTIAAYPDNFTTEASAFGAIPAVTKNGLPGAAYIWTEPSMLDTLPMLDETDPVKLVLERIAKTPAGKTALLKVNGPYSVLASLVEPSLLYRWLQKNRNELHHALAAITRGLASYMIKASKRGAKIFSLADPYANMSILGKKRYIEFAAHYLVLLLRMITDRGRALGGVIHLCPYSSAALEELRLVRADILPTGYGGKTYIEVVENYMKNNRKGKTILAGHQCIYREGTGRIIVLNIRNGDLP
jgi:uroporphyrinogen-III decarboxylase